MTGAHTSWAATGTATASASGRGSPRAVQARAQPGASSTRPPVASDRQREAVRPRQPRVGEQQDEHRGAERRRGCAGGGRWPARAARPRPSRPPAAPTAAVGPARRTPPSPPPRAAGSHRPRSPAQRPTSSTKVTTIARLAPLTAVRWVSPAVRKSSTRSGRHPRRVAEDQARQQPALGRRQHRALPAAARPAGRRPPAAPAAGRPTSLGGPRTETTAATGCAGARRTEPTGQPHPLPGQQAEPAPVAGEDERRRPGAHARPRTSTRSSRTGTTTRSAPRSRPADGAGIADRVGASPSPVARTVAPSAANSGQPAAADGRQVQRADRASRRRGSRTHEHRGGRGRRPAPGQPASGRRRLRRAAPSDPTDQPSRWQAGGEPVATKVPPRRGGRGDQAGVQALAPRSFGSGGRLAGRGPAHTVTDRPQVGQGRLADARDLTQLVDRAEPAVRGAPVEDPLGQHRPDAGQPVQRLERRGVEVDRAGRRRSPPRRCRGARDCAAVRRRPAGRRGDRTTTCSPSTSGRARLTLAVAAAAVAPPAAATASATRDPAGSRTRPGRCTAPATWTTTSAGRCALPPGRCATPPRSRRDRRRCAVPPRRTHRRRLGRGLGLPDQQHRHEHGDQQDDRHARRPPGGPGAHRTRGRLGGDRQPAAAAPGRRRSLRHPATGSGAGCRRQPGQQPGRGVVGRVRAGGAARVACSPLDARNAGAAARGPPTADRWTSEHRGRAVDDGRRADRQRGATTTASMPGPTCAPTTAPTSLTCRSASPGSRLAQPLGQRRGAVRVRQVVHRDVDRPGTRTARPRAPRAGRSPWPRCAPSPAARCARRPGAATASPPAPSRATRRPAPIRPPRRRCSRVST